MSFGQGYLNYPVQGLVRQPTVFEGQVPGVGEFFPFHGHAAQRFGINNETLNYVPEGYNFPNAALFKGDKDVFQSTGTAIPNQVTASSSNAKPKDHSLPSQQASITEPVQRKSESSTGVSGSKPYSCDRCSYSSDRKHRLEMHIETIHLKIKKFHCNLCEYKTNGKSNLGLHIKTAHMKVKDSLCSLCDFRTYTKYLLKRHVERVHLQLKKFECDRCEYKTNIRSNMNKHIGVVHLKQKFKSEVLCGQCDFRTSNKGELNRHVRYKHTKLTTFPCEICEYEAPTNTSLNAHIETVHLRLKSFKCDMCEFQTGTKSRLKVHSQTVHLKRRKDYPCERICSFETTSKAALKKHIENHHLRARRAVEPAVKFKRRIAIGNPSSKKKDISPPDKNSQAITDQSINTNGTYTPYLIVTSSATDDTSNLDAENKKTSAIAECFSHKSNHPTSKAVSNNTSLDCNDNRSFGVSNRVGFEENMTSNELGRDSLSTKNSVDRTRYSIAGTSTWVEDSTVDCSTRKLKVGNSVGFKMPGDTVQNNAAFGISNGNMSLKHISVHQGNHYSTADSDGSGDDVTSCSNAGSFLGEGVMADSHKGTGAASGDKISKVDVISKDPILAGLDECVPKRITRQHARKTEMESKKSSLNGFTSGNSHTTKKKSSKKVGSSDSFSIPVGDPINNVYHCELCEFRTLYRRCLEQHIKNIHLKIKDFECKHCDYRTGDKYALNRHVDRTHLGLKKFRCHICGFKTTQKHYLVRHNKCVHLRERNYLCSECPYRAFDKATLDQHIYNNHVK